MNEGKSFKDPAIYKRILGVQNDGKELVYVWQVDGKYVRTNYDIDFVEGSHHYVNDDWPENEVMIDDALDEGENSPVIIHELSERDKMKFEHAPYLRTHENVANRRELRGRRNPEEYQAELSKLGFKWLQPLQRKVRIVQDAPRLSFQQKMGKVNLSPYGDYTGKRSRGKRKFPKVITSEGRVMEVRRGGVMS